MRKIDLITEEFPDIEFLQADGFDDAIIGVDYQNERLVYSESKCIEIMMNDRGMIVEDAKEHFDFNVAGSYIGEKTPVWGN